MTADSRSVSPGANCIPAAGSWQVDEPPQPRTETTSGMVLVRPGQLEVAPEASGGVNARTDENVDDHFAKARLRVATPDGMIAWILVFWAPLRGCVLGR